MLVTIKEKNSHELLVLRPLSIVTSRKSVVPAAVPSLRHRPCAPLELVARKKTQFLKDVSKLGLEEAALGLMSATRTVPAAVPSLFQSSLPKLSPLAAK